MKKIIFALGIIFGMCASAVPQAGTNTQIQITKAQDFVFGDVARGVNSTLTCPVCIYAPGSNGTYYVTGTGYGPGFLLKNAISDSYTMTYRARWQRAGKTTWYTLVSGVRNNTQMRNADTRSPTCGGGTNAVLEIRVQPTTTQATGDYSGIISILVSFL